MLVRRLLVLLCRRLGNNGRDLNMRKFKLFWIKKKKNFLNRFYLLMCGNFLSSMCGYNNFVNL